MQIRNKRESYSILTIIIHYRQFTFVFNVRVQTRSCLFSSNSLSPFSHPFPPSLLSFFPCLCPTIFANPRLKTFFVVYERYTLFRFCVFSHRKNSSILFLFFLLCRNKWKTLLEYVRFPLGNPSATLFLLYGKQRYLFSVFFEYASAIPYTRISLFPLYTFPLFAFYI